MKNLPNVVYIAILFMGVTGVCRAQNVDKSQSTAKQDVPGMTERNHPMSKELRTAISDAWLLYRNLAREARDRYRDGKFAEAIKLCYDAQKYAPPGADGALWFGDSQLTLGCAYLHLGDDQKALQMLLPLNDSSLRAEAYLAESIAFARLGNGKMAREMFQRFQLSGEEIRMRTEQLWKDMDKDTDQMQFLTRAWHAYGNLSLSGKPKLAVLQYQAAKSLDPNNPLTDYDLGFVLSRLERYEEASKYFQRAASLGKGDLVRLAHKEFTLSLRDLGEQKIRQDVEMKKQTTAPVS